MLTVSQKLLGCCNYRVRPSLVPLIIQPSCAIDGRKGETGRADVELLLRDRGFYIVSVTPRRRRVSPRAEAAIAHSKTSAIAPPMRSPQRPATPCFSRHLAFHDTLLFEGDDFSHTDICPALPAAT